MDTLNTEGEAKPETHIRVDCGDWRLDREIGRGAYGVVYLATNGKGERAAVKVCRRSDVGDERYERELRGTKLYSSIPPQEGLVRMRAFAEESWGFYAVMDLADDEFASDGVASSGRAASPFAAASSVYRPKTLARVIEGEKALPLKECVKLALSLAKGLSVLQRHHLLHRDIKPGNVLYVGGCPVLSDPGLIVEESEAASLVGTPGYVPPEKFTDAASDIYSLGLTLKAASFGRQVEDLDKGPAMEADTGAALFPVWWRILNKAADPTPSRRYQSAKALIKDLNALRRKMVLSSFWRSWMPKAAIVLTLIGLIVIGVSSRIGTNGLELRYYGVDGKPLTEEDIQYGKKLRKFIREASDWFQTAVNVSTSAYTVSHRLSKELSRKIKETTDGSEAEKLSKTQTELLELKEKLREVSVKICMLQIEHEESRKNMVGPTRRDVEEKLQAAQKLLKEGDAYQKQTWEIGLLIHGKKWEPPNHPLHETPDGIIDASRIEAEARRRIRNS